MTLLEASREEGRQEGRQEGRHEGRREGRTEGSLIGQIQLCENLLGRAQRPAEELGALTLGELQAELRLVEQQVKSRWKAS